MAKKAPARKKVEKRPYGPRVIIDMAKKPLTKSPYSKKELKAFNKLLLNLRDRIVDEISFLASGNLSRAQGEVTGELSSYSLHMADQGTDNFDREFALNLVSSEQDLIYEIEEAISRIDVGTYGICELSGRKIEKERLKVVPYARNSVKAQEALEKSQGRSRNRPYSNTSYRR